MEEQKRLLALFQFSNSVTFKDPFRQEKRFGPFQVGFFETSLRGALNVIAVGISHVNALILYSRPSRIFSKSDELTSHVLAIRLYFSEWEVCFDSHLLPLIRPLYSGSINLLLGVLAFFLVRTFTRRTYYNRIHSCFVSSIKTALQLFFIAILLQLKCVYFNRAQARAALILWRLFWAERERHKDS